MPYRSLDELPDGVRDHLPRHAQEIYKEAFNHAWVQYADPGERRDAEAGREETAHKVAWAAVKQGGYEKGRDGDWHRRRAI